MEDSFKEEPLASLNFFYDYNDYTIHFNYNTHQNILS